MLFIYYHFVCVCNKLIDLTIDNNILTMLSIENWRIFAFDFFFSIQKKIAFLLLCLYINFIDLKKTRFSFVVFLLRQSLILSIQSISFDAFASRRSISIVDDYTFILFQYWNRIQFSIFFDIEAFSFELFLSNFFNEKFVYFDNNRINFNRINFNRIKINKINVDIFDFCFFFWKNDFTNFINFD